jgi:hypothetical protein
MGKLLFTPQDLERLKLNARHPKFRDFWAKVLKSCSDAPVAVQESPSTPKPLRARPCAELLLPLALAYRVEGQYGNAGREQLLNLAAADDNTAWINPFHQRQHPCMRSDLDTAGILINMVLGWEAFQDLLTSEDTSKIKEGILAKGIEPILTDTENGIWWANAYNSNWCGIMYSSLGLVSLLLLPDAVVARRN